MSEKIALVGNPGVGKSFLLNSTIKQNKFKNGFSFQGVTQKLQIETKNNKDYIDTPGFDDIKNKKATIKEIQKALKLNGNYKIFFVITLEGGRIRNIDAILIEIILQSLENVPNLTFGIIVNKLDNESLNYLKDEENFLAFHVEFRKLIPSLKSVEQIYLMKKYSNLENGFLPLEDHFFNFIENFESTFISSDLVQDLKVSDFEKIEDKIFKQQKLFEEMCAKQSNEFQKAIEVLRGEIVELKKKQSKSNFFSNMMEDICLFAVDVVKAKVTTALLL